MRFVFRVLLPLTLVALLALRIGGERIFSVHATAAPSQVSAPDSPLKAKTDLLLAAALDSEQSLFYPLGSAREALVARIELVEAATHTLDLQYYLFHDDEAGRALLGAVVDAARRGVKVRLLIDDMDTKDRDEYFNRLAQEQDNLDIRVFNPALLRSFRAPEYIARFPRVTRRMHNKSFTVDNIVSVVGGRNIGNEYFDINTETAFDDLDVLGAGPVALKVSRQFNLYWHSGLAVDARRLGSPAPDNAFTTYLGKLKQAKESFDGALVAGAGSVFHEVYQQIQEPYFGLSEVVYDKPEKVISSLFDTEANLSKKIVELMETAQRELLISSPYFIPGKIGLNTFKKLRNRGVKITILTNSFAANDVAIVHAGYLDYRKKLLAMGVELYELKPSTDNRKISLFGARRASLHAKSFIVDKGSVYVGSFNLDPRSAIHNTEMGVVFYNEDYGSAIHQNLKTYLESNTWRVNLQGQNKIEWHGKLADGSTETLNEEPMTGAMTRVLLYAASWLPVEWLL